ncbi:MAG: pitrilysin family protein [Vicingaceae bacterium]
MIEFKKHVLNNGLKLIVHKDKSTPVVAFNLLYNVGARDENPNRTGFAHLFEHLMFGGSKHIPNFDKPLQKAGGENNAFTSNDITNYYITIPKNNLETAFWLDSDRMMELAFSPKSLEVQRNVVIEEFKQRYLNQPYGDVWLHLRPLAYKKHPYQWPTIGKEIKHIEDANLSEVKSFFYKFYRPNNAVLSIAGDVDFNEMVALTEKWFGDIPKGEIPIRNYPKEPKQKEYRLLKLERDVPANAIYMAFHMVDRLNPDYYVFDLISDVLSNGQSSRLYNKLIKEKKYFSEIQAYVTGSFDDGLLVISGKLNDNIDFATAELAVWDELSELEKIKEEELQKVKNKVESALVFSEVNVLNKAMTLAVFETLGNADWANDEPRKYQNVSIERFKKIAKDTFIKDNCSVLHYYAKK